MKVLEDYEELEGKTIAFSHMAQFADQITIATEDGSVLMAAFDFREDSLYEHTIRVLNEPHVLGVLNSDAYLRNCLGNIGIFDLKAYEEEQERKRQEHQDKFRLEQEEREKKKAVELYKKHKEHVERQLNISHKVEFIINTGSSVVPEEQAEEILAELEKENGIYGHGITMDGMVVIERQ